jgi:hypothetical protein
MVIKMKPLKAHPPVPLQLSSSGGGGALKFSTLLLLPGFLTLKVPSQRL